MKRTPLLFSVSAALVLLAWGCSSTDEPGTPDTAGATGPAEPELPAAEDPNAATERLLKLERAMDQWHAANQRQQYDRRDSIELLLRDYTAKHFDDIVRDLRTGPPRRRKVMAASLGFSGRQEAVPALADALKDQVYEVVLHALLSLYVLAGTEEDLTGQEQIDVQIDPEIVLPYLRHPRAEVRSNAAMVLIRLLGPKSDQKYMLPLVAAAEDADPATRVHAVAALGAMRRPEALPHLINALGDPVELVRIRAALALARLKDRAAVPHLLEALKRPEEAEDVRSAVARALHELVGGSMTRDAEVWERRAAEAGVLTPPPRIEDGAVNPDDGR